MTTHKQAICWWAVFVVSSPLNWFLIRFINLQAAVVNIVHLAKKRGLIRAVFNDEFYILGAMPLLAAAVLTMCTCPISCYVIHIWHLVINLQPAAWVAHVPIILSLSSSFGVKLLTTHGSACHAYHDLAYWDHIAYWPLLVIERKYRTRINIWSATLSLRCSLVSDSIHKSIYKEATETSSETLLGHYTTRFFSNVLKISLTSELMFCDRLKRSSELLLCCSK